MNPEFTQEFDLERGRYELNDEYSLFISQLRLQVRDPGQFARGVPILPRPAEPPTRFFDVVLKTSADSLNSLKLRFRRDNLYLIAYQDGNEQWNGFADTYQLVPDCADLRVESGYESLGRWAKKGREKIELGWNKLLNAVRELAGNTASGQEKASALIVIIEMISESLRFVEIRRGIYNNYTQSIEPSKKPDLLERFKLLENKWDDLSLAVQYPGEKLHLSDETSKKLKMETIEQVKRALGMALYMTVPKKGKAAIGKATTQNGRHLVEFFDMRILNINSEGPGKVYGAIIAANGLQNDYVYSRDREDHESIEPGQYATLTGPSRTISAIDDFNLDFNLKSRDALSAEDEVANSRIAWNATDQANKYDEVRTDIINGPSGSVALDYVVMSNATEALVDIVLVDWDGEDLADVYGEIYAQTFSFPEKRIKLFRRESHDPVGVHPHSCVPLLRSALAVPMDASLTIRASLWNHGRTSDKEIANGTAEFEPATLQSASGLITGQHGKLEVRVSWI
ncbi:Ribosome-inactivating protein [Penicillium alfredii]|uniref:rRNA N-glycosylase n=1 Tax=Penicillium alfredii TaxID=1506179 RepID=A0A9W9FS53_9EURO|nr:Ribosome-inactivating protein [Penicillium alfredii]KAJ5105020.1 Ribosome-inactivating protein [Penicillium alfredii]